MIRIDAMWLAANPIDMRAGADRGRRMKGVESIHDRLLSEVIGPPAPQIVPKKHVALPG
jgi:hypothetical protein